MCIDRRNERYLGAIDLKLVRKHVGQRPKKLHLSSKVHLLPNSKLEDSVEKMSVFKYTNRLHSVFHARARFLHSSSVCNKQYAYDLNSLIEWKKETIMAFGPARKPTKTGKLRKTRKGLDQHIQENLETLSAISAHRDAALEDFITPAIQCTNKRDKNYTRNVIPSDISICKPTSEILSAEGQYYQRKSSDDKKKGIGCSMEESFNIPDNISSMIPHDAVSVTDSYDDDGKECGEPVLYDPKDDIVIGKISPIPVASSKKSSAFKFVTSPELLSPACIKDYSTNQSMDVTADASIRGDITNTTAAVYKPSSATSDYSKNKFTKKASKTKEDTVTDSMHVLDVKVSKKEKLAEAEIFIPKIQPIPMGNIALTPKTVTTPNIPIEPPQSFDVITKIPMFPNETREWQSDIKSHLLAAFTSDVEQLSLRALPSVKAILNKTMSDLNRFFLNRWREGMIKELGEEGFARHQEATIKNGLNLHANIMEHLSGKPMTDLQIMPDNEGHWSSLQAALSAICNVRALELELCHKMLHYRGVFDCLAQYKDLLCLIDWKTSKKTRPLLKNTYDDPVQIAAYIGALNSNETYVKKYGQVNHGLIVVAYPDGSPAHIHMMNRVICEQYWHDWTERLYNYYQLTYTEKMAKLEKINAKKMEMSN